MSHSPHTQDYSATQKLPQKKIPVEEVAQAATRSSPSTTWYSIALKDKLNLNHTLPRHILQDNADYALGISAKLKSYRFNHTHANIVGQLERRHSTTA
ncbi:hypothetical protein E2C01_088954 [Portunus trituberculatus]|uniref:Uncharacterized protein n=1 Tax=Portunus trituberculatus TaxID=210409 RepID=A0A5B7JC85_PORTR|nr:hypothetical protein [Portunus trituberculatus]